MQTLQIQENPFTPTFGEVPARMAGRAELLGNLRKAFAQKTRSPYLATLITGARGTGKTALLTLAAREAESLGWVSVNTVALPGLLDDVLIGARRAARHIVDSDYGAKLKGVGLGGAVNLEWDYESEPSNWRSKMTDLLEALEAHGTGLLISVDEVQPSLDELVRLVATYQLFVQEGRKVALLMAGLPHNVVQLLQDKSVSFLRRAQTVHLGRLSDAEVEIAMRQTVDQAGRSLDDEAAQAMAKAAGGFPFMMQLVGYQSWEVQPDEPIISLSDAQVGMRLAQGELISRVVEPTYRGLSEGDRRFLAAMAEGEGPQTVSSVAARMGKSVSYASQYKRRLLDQGVLGEDEGGRIDFDMPLMREHVISSSQRQ